LTFIDPIKINQLNQNFFEINDKSVDIRDFLRYNHITD